MKQEQEIAENLEKENISYDDIDVVGKESAENPEKENASLHVIDLVEV